MIPTLFENSFLMYLYISQVQQLANAILLKEYLIVQVSNKIMELNLYMHVHFTTKRHQFQVSMIACLTVIEAFHVLCTLPSIQ